MAKKIPAAHLQEPVTVMFSIWILAIGFIASSFFAILICFYPGPKFLGANFWPMFGLFAILALGIGIKMLFRTPILQINKLGIHFYRSKKNIPWQLIQKAEFMSLAIDGDRTDEKRFLVVQYFDEANRELMEIDFSLTGLMNKNEEELTQAINVFYHKATF